MDITEIYNKVSVLTATHVDQVTGECTDHTIGKGSYLELMKKKLVNRIHDSSTELSGVEMVVIEDVTQGDYNDFTEFF